MQEEKAFYLLNDFQGSRISQDKNVETVTQERYLEALSYAFAEQLLSDIKTK